MMKDRFSTGADKYALYRPGYPESFFDYLNTIAPAFENAWDCGTGNGQLAQRLRLLFQQVQATDISEAQLKNAVPLPNVHYSIQPAEHTSFPDNFFDLIAVAQAIHWFDFEAFYAEVRRTAKAHALLVVIGYGRLRISKELDAVIDDFYTNKIGSFWDKERRYIDEDYQTIPFPFTELQPPHFTHTFPWTLDQLVGYLETWSAVKNYKRQKGNNPVDSLYPELKKLWGDEERRIVTFPFLLRIGKVHE